MYVVAYFLNAAIVTSKLPSPLLGSKEHLAILRGKLPLSLGQAKDNYWSNWCPADSLKTVCVLTVVASTSWCNYSYSDSPQEGLGLVQSTSSTHTPLT